MARSGKSGFKSPATQMLRGTRGCAVKILGLRSGIQRGFCAFFVFFIILLTSQAVGSSANLAVSPSTVNFGTVPVGSSQTQSITLTNPGGPRVTVVQARVSGTAFVLSGLGYPLSLAGGQSATCSITFAPGVAGNKSASLSIELSGRRDDGGNYSRSWTLSVPVSGTGVASGQLALSPTRLDFGNVQVGTSQSQWETLTNVGGATVTISQITEAGTGFSVNALSLPAALGPNQSLTFSTAFAPQIAGSAVAAITVISDASNSTLTIPQTGTGVAQGQLIVSPASANFGSVVVGTSTSQAGTLSATGASVTVSSASVSNPEFAISGVKFPLTIAAGQGVPIAVAFSPQASGAALGTLSFSSNASNIPTEVLTGYGVAPAPNTLAINTASLPNGTVGTSYSTVLSATGGSTPYKWNVSAGSLPAGLSLNGGTGGISGTPVTAGQTNISFQVIDSSSPPQSVSANLSISISNLGPPSGAAVVTSFGATGDGVTDDTAAINAAIASLQPGQTLFFPCGTYAISAALSDITLNGVTVTGASANCVTLKLTGSSSFTALRVAGGGLSGSQNLTADATSNTFTVAAGGLAALGITAGSYVMVSDAGYPSNGPGSPLISNQEVVKVTSVSGDTATIDQTFSYPFTLVSPYPSVQGCCPYVQKIVPLTNATVKYLTIDGAANTGNSIGIQLDYAVGSEVGYVTISNFLGTGASGGALFDTGYQNNIHDLACNSCGNGGGSGGGFDSVDIQRQSFATVNNISLTNKASQSVFGFSLRQVHWSTVSNLMVDAGGANGRPIKLQRADHNTINYATAKNGTGGHNGISVTDISQYNTFNNCVALNNTGKGIATFGTYNTHNTFNNCTAKYNTEAQFGQFAAYDGSYNDHYTSINGGTFCCARGASAVLYITSNNFTMSGAVVNDDSGVGIDGLVLNGTNAVVQNNTFSHLPAGKDIYAVNAPNATFSGNATPDGTTPSGLGNLLRKAKVFFAALKHPFTQRSMDL